MKNEQFYNAASEYYDEMISFQSALGRKLKLVSNVVTGKMKAAADLGCGTGIDSIALTGLGLKVTAFDPSDKMINKAKTNAGLAGVKINYNNYSIHNIPHKFDNQFELVVSMGNTFANIARESFEDSLQKCYDILGREGVLIIHILNYHKIIREKNRIVNITQGHGQYFIRFYDLSEDEISFNILTFNQSQPTDHKIISTKLIPYGIQNFEKALLKIGFQSVEFYSNLNWDQFDLHCSSDLFVKTAKG
jgi:ubiquinone/menaquinone biosynthesis C-methylase UbiE